MESMTTPTHRDDSADDYSDVASIKSDSESKPRRKHQRGGRKESYEEPSAEDLAGLLGPEPSPKTENYEQEEDNTCQYCSQKTPPTKPAPKRRIPDPFETGIRAFNVRKAAGGRRPVAVRAGSNTQKKSKSPAPRPAVNKTPTSRSDDAGYETQSQESSPKSGKEEEPAEEQDQSAGAKPMSIRLDLDLMIEVFLKAKIKGSVTVTFLD